MGKLNIPISISAKHRADKIEDWGSLSTFKYISSQIPDHGAEQLRSWGAEQLSSWGAEQLSSWAAEELSPMMKLFTKLFLVTGVRAQWGPEFWLGPWLEAAVYSFTRVTNLYQHLHISTTMNNNTSKHHNNVFAVLNMYFTIKCL